MTVATLSLPRSFHPTDDEALPARPGLAFAFRGVGKSFADKRVLGGIDLDVPSGQFVAIIGKSGCGKSTLLRLLAGLERPDGGSLVHGSPAEGFSTTRFMFQEPRLLPWKNIVRNVEIGLTGIHSGDQARQMARAMLAKVGLADREGEWPAVLSGGQKQRVALARALVGSPKILALDEPLGALDALTRIEMQDLLEGIWLDRKFTAVLVTHDVGEAVSLADRVVVIDQGRIALDLAVPVPRPRRHGDPRLARIEGQVLDKLFDRAARA